LGQAYGAARLPDLLSFIRADCSRLSLPLLLRSPTVIARSIRELDWLVRAETGRQIAIWKSHDALERNSPSEVSPGGRQDNITIPDRHLGLVPTAEINQLDT